MMKRRKSPLPRFAVCIDNRDFPASLELHRIYRVLPDSDAAEDGDLRIVDESGEDYLYPAKRFVMLKVPADLSKTLSRSLARNAARAA